MMKMSRESQKLLKLFKGWDDKFVVYPSGRFWVVYERKGPLQKAVAVEGWLDETFDTASTISMSSLNADEYIHIDLDPLLAKIDPDRLLKADPVLKFTLSRWNVDALKTLARTKPPKVNGKERFSLSEFVSVSNTDSDIETLHVDDSDGRTLFVDIQTKIDAPEAKTFDLPYRLFQLLTLDEYHVTGLSNDLCVFRSCDLGLSFYVRLAANSDKQPKDNTASA